MLNAEKEDLLAIARVLRRGRSAAIEPSVKFISGGQI
jgi:hypothetical protein